MIRKVDDIFQEEIRSQQEAMLCVTSCHDGVWPCHTIIYQSVRLLNPPSKVTIFLEKLPHSN